MVDGLFRVRPDRPAHKQIVLIAYDDRSSLRHFGSPKIPSRDLLQLFEILAQEKPKAVGLLIPVNEKQYSSADLEQLAGAFSRVPHVLMGYLDESNLGKPGPMVFSDKVPFVPGIISRDEFSYGADWVTRRVMVTINGLSTLYSELARIDAGTTLPLKFQNAQPYGDTGNFQIFLNWQGPAGTYPIYSTEQVLEKNFPKGIFSNKVLLIGNTLTPRPAVENFVITPYSRNRKDMTLLEGAAQGLATLLDDNALTRSGSLLNFTLSVVISLVTVNLVLFLSPLVGMLFVIGEILLLFVAGWLLLSYGDYWLDLAHPFIMACFGYYLVIPYRLVNEYRKRWHYQEKSEMIAQLETLKTNFLNLVSHDLKTPIARIQGNAELLLQNLRPTEGKSQGYLNAIVETTDHLGQYIETILDLTRIDSSGFTLQKTTKDINAVIESIVDSKRSMAAEKKIEITTDLEPLFAFKFDSRLIHRVIANLIENAIRYSPENTCITVSSKEESSWIRVSVNDNGIGISQEDQERIFTKFYRCTNELTHKNKGTGLGLYLVKYFVELHQGVVQLQSEIGKGSRFTISLPM